MQSTPRVAHFSEIYLDLASARASMELSPEFSAKTEGMVSRASANPLTAYYSTDSI